MILKNSACLLQKINKDYKKYFNERASIVVGKNARNVESEIQAIEERMMIQVLQESRTIENLKNDKYSYNELRKICIHL